MPRRRVKSFKPNRSFLRLGNGQPFELMNIFDPILETAKQLAIERSGKSWKARNTRPIRDANMPTTKSRRAQQSCFAGARRWRVNGKTIIMRKVTR